MSTETKEAQKYNNKVQFNRDNYVLRIMAESFGPSGKGNPTITLDFEVAAPETMEVAGTHYSIVGTKIRKWYVTQVLNQDGTVNVEKTQNCKNRLQELYEKLGMDFTGFNPENPTLEFKGKLVYALLYSKSKEDRKSPTSEQLAAGQTEGDVIINPVTKQPRLKYQIEIDTIDGLAPADAAPAY